MDSGVYVLGLMKNLLSLNRITDTRLKIDFDADDCLFKNAKGHCEGHLYKVMFR